MKINKAVICLFKVKNYQTKATANHSNRKDLFVHLRWFCFNFIIGTVQSGAYDICFYVYVYVYVFRSV